MAIYQGLSLGLGAVSAIPQWITGENQEDRADQLSSRLIRPEMEVPESQKRALTSAEQQAKMTRLPSQSAIEGRIDQTTANKIAMIERIAGGGPTAINAASRAYGQQMDAEADLGKAAAEMNLRNQDILRDELGKTAGYEMSAWNWNERLPYEQKATAIEALREASIRNKNAAFKDLTGGLATFFGGMDSGGGSRIDWNALLSTGNQPLIMPDVEKTIQSSKRFRTTIPVLESFKY